MVRPPGKFPSLVFPSYQELEADSSLGKIEVERL